MKKSVTARNRCAPRSLVLVCLVILSCSGCALMDIKEQTQVVASVGCIRGVVKVTSQQKGAVFVLGFREDNGILTLRNKKPVSSQGTYEFGAVLPGQYLVAAFIDVNRDGQYQDGEHGFYHLDPLTISVSSGETTTVRPLVVSGDPPSRPAHVKMEVDLGLIVKNIGKVTTLADPAFVEDNGSLGMWQPIDFLHQVGGGLFLLQEYEKDTIPLIFVHGIGGGPKNWESVIALVDRERFQPWCLYYPSGLRLDMTSDYFVQAVEELRNRHGFMRFAVAAHSMGGLVTRSFVKKYNEQFPEHAKGISFVLTVNSPMGGMPSASSGVKHSPIVVPAWRDIVPGSEFLRDLHAWTWPRHTPYHLVFSYKTGDSGDGVVPLKMQIPLGLQAESVRMYGFNNDHVGTLHDEAFMKLFISIIQSVQVDATNRSK